MKKSAKSLLAMGLSVCFFFSDLTICPVTNVKAQSENTVTLGKGSYSTVTKGKQVYSEQAGLVDRTTEQAWWPKRSVPGNVYVTDNMKGAIPTNDWATSFLWGTMYGGVSNPFSEPAYAFPLAYKATSEGMYLTQPPLHMVTQSSGALDYCMPLQTGYIDLAVKPTGFTPTDAKVDKVTDWSYDIVMEKGNQQMKTIMAQGSPFAYFESKNTDLEVNFKRGTQMKLVKGDSDDTTVVIKVLDNKENDWNYYALFGPKGVKWNFAGSSVSVSKITADLPDDRSYMSIAILPDESTKYLATYEKYAYNFITDTEATWFYDDQNGDLVTCYFVRTDNKEESKEDGALYGLLPHQWKNCPKEYEFMDTTYETVRGTMKLLCTSGCFETRLKYTGILPFMPQVAKGDEEQLRTYLNDYMEKTKNNKTPYIFIGEGNGDTYWTGKALNKLVNVMAVAEQLGETQKAAILLNTLKGVLEDWFSTDDAEQDNYFYYDSEVGTLVGYPSNFGSDTQLNDHHFHYGYWIYAAAQVALRDPEWIKDSNWGGMVKELVGDIASTDRDNQRYPYLRNFAPYEGHSWASGHQLFTDGNNQESSSEAINAWAGIILLGEATNDRQLRDLGIYLYTTEVSAIENYWFDIDKDVLSPQFRYRDESATSYNKDRKEVQTQASMIWGGKYIYGTWWTAEPLQVQGINLLPMTGASLYLAKNKDYIKENYSSARELEKSYTGGDKLANPNDRWNDIWHEYLALADPDMALENWSATADEESGETRVHTYQYMKSLLNYGTPDLTVTANCPLSAVFNKSGVKSYCAYNTSDEMKTVTFTDGAEITVAPHSMYIGKSGTGNQEELATTKPPVQVTSNPPVQETVAPPTEPVILVPSETPVPIPSSESKLKAYFDADSYLVAKSDCNEGNIVFTKDVEWVDVHYYYGAHETTLHNVRMTRNGDTWSTPIKYMNDYYITAFFTYFDKEKGYAIDTKPETICFGYFPYDNVHHVDEKPKADENGEVIPPIYSKTPEWLTQPIVYFDENSYLERFNETSCKIVFLKDAEWVKVRVTYGFYERESTFDMVKGEDNWYLPFTIQPPEIITVDFTYLDKKTGEEKHTDYATINCQEGSANPTGLPKQDVCVSPTPSPSASDPKLQFSLPPSPTPSLAIESTESYIRKNYNPQVSFTSTVGGNVSLNYTISAEGTLPMDLAKLKIRYYYEKEGEKPQNFWCDNAGLQLSTAPWYQNIADEVKGTFYDGYLELSFITDKQLENDGSCLNMGIRFAQSDWSSYVGLKEIGLKVYYDEVLLTE